jgi:hypothetical protein
MTSRPTPGEIIDGVRRILRDIVGPAITSEHAASKLRDVRDVLAQVPWDDLASIEQAHREATAQAVGLALTWRAEDVSRAALFGGSDQTPISDDRDASRLADIATELTQWSAKHPADHSAADLRLTLMAALPSAQE